MTLDPNATPFIRAAKFETMMRDFNRLREACRSQGTPDVQEAWDKCERWLWAVTPETEGSK